MSPSAKMPCGYLGVESGTACARTLVQIHLAIGDPDYRNIGTFLFNFLSKNMYLVRFGYIL